MKCDKAPSKIGQRLWSRDASLWTGEADEQTAIENRLGWLDAPVWLRSKINGLVSWADEIRAAGFDRAVVLGRGGSSLAAEVMARIFGQGPGGLALTVLDNTHPDAVRAVLESGHLESTLFLVASKSGTTLEANVFLVTFLEALRQRVGADAGNHFVVITDVVNHGNGSKFILNFLRIFFQNSFLTNFCIIQNWCGYKYRRIRTNNNANNHSKRETL